MNAPDPLVSLQSVPDLTVPGRIATLNCFDLEQFQHLSKEDLLLAQSIAGHGSEWGIWETPVTLSPGKMAKMFRAVSFAKRLRHFLTKEPLPETSPDLLNVLVEEGVLVLTRLALLFRLTPTGGRISKNQRLKPSNLIKTIHAYVAKIVARAIQRKAARPETHGLYACLTEDDVQELSQNERLRMELERLQTLAARSLWNDLPLRPERTRTTNPSGPKQGPVPQVIGGEWQPIPDAYLAEFGPRNLWLIRDLGPSLLPLMEDLASYLESLDWSKINKDKLIGESGLLAQFIDKHLQNHPWKDRTGRPLKPFFPLMTGPRSKDSCAWPPRNYLQLKVLSATLQSAHLFLTLLANAARIGEVESLRRSCVTTERDGKDYVNGWTYKLSDSLYGDARQWPAPKVLVQALGQQVRLANVWSRLPAVRVQDGLLARSLASDVLWLSIGGSNNNNAAGPLWNPGAALRKLAVRIGMDPKPGGINLHPHRCRKTIGRLAGVALQDSPLVLKRLFGHKSIEMVLHYILCDKDIFTEAEKVLRELRILNCAEALEEVHEALARGAPLPGHSGAGASRIVDSIKDYETHLSASGRVWSDASAYDLAYLLTASGQGWRLVQPDIICAKVPGESGLCRKNKGEPDTSNCKPECSNRVVLARKRRDVDEIVECYLDLAHQALVEEQYGIFHNSMKQLLEEIDIFPDIKAQRMADPQVQSLLAIYQELP